MDSDDERDSTDESTSDNEPASDDEPASDGESTKRAEKVSEQLADTHSNLRTISTRLNEVVADGARDTIDKLENAMNKTYDIAVFIRGDYDHHDTDESQKRDVLHQAVVAFEVVEERAEEGLKDIGNLQARVSIDIRAATHFWSSLYA